MSRFLQDLATKFTGESAMALKIINDNESILRVQAAALALQQKMHSMGQSFDFQVDNPRQVTAVEILDRALSAGVTDDEINQWRKWLDTNNRTPDGIPNFMQILAKSGHTGEAGRNAVLMAQAAARISSKTNALYQNSNTKHQQWLEKLDKATANQEWIGRESNSGVRAAQAFAQTSDILAISLENNAVMAQTDKVREAINALRVLSSRAMSAAVEEARVGGFQEAVEKLEPQIQPLAMGTPAELTNKTNRELVGSVARGFEYIFDHMPKEHEAQLKQIDQRLGNLFDSALGIARSPREQEGQPAPSDNVGGGQGVSHVERVSRSGPASNSMASSPYGS